MRQGLLTSLILGFSLRAMDYQSVSSSKLDNYESNNTQQAGHQQECIGDEIIHIYCKGNNLYSIDNCGLEELWLVCVESRCYRGDCVDEAK